MFTVREFIEQLCGISQLAGSGERGLGTAGFKKEKQKNTVK